MRKLAIFRATHRIPISASFAITRLLGKPFRLNLSPSIQYTENWYLRTQRKHLDSSSGQLITESVAGFTPIRIFSTSLSANTEFYGIFPWKIGSYQGFRHIVRPTVSFTYRPDFSRPFWGYYRSYQDANGKEILACSIKLTLTSQLLYRLMQPYHPDAWLTVYIPDSPASISPLSRL